MVDDPEADLSWAGYRRLVISELERIDKGVKGLHEKMDARDSATDREIAKMKTEIAMLKVKSGMISALVSALVTIAGTIAIVLLRLWR
jgi:hypothetical protein